ncbi:SPOR domain-containing protein [Anianabacter salinae]|uniref:SPOR domain-containing protein n=1 Tax=Anianabacter salinae TaxID=2851023 RepID=UPI00225E6750|nr:SPOR domain-containing protein [Anianabacter salinae]MBV0912424.1 SPOR domain-containing protein [Anianabacter salinae]
MASFPKGRYVLSFVALTALAGCSDGATFPFSGSKDTGTRAASSPTSVTLVDRDVEAPDVFQKTTGGLWDGRPSLGGVWVAHPDVGEPERVIIRNEANGKFVIGALFRKERATPGPDFQVSSDAAAAIGMLAGSPTELNVTALRREEVPVGGEVAASGALPAAPAVETASLDAPDTGTGINDAESRALAAEALAAAGSPAPRPAPAVATGAAPAPTLAAATRAPSSLSKPFIQIGLFSIEDNATRTGGNLRAKGMTANVIPDSSNGKKYWRVTVGPAASESERAALLGNVKAMGFEDAYFVSN